LAFSLAAGCCPRRSEIDKLEMIVRRGGSQLKLGAFFNPTGHHVASWRHPDAQADAGVNFKHYVEIAQTAERGKFDLIFLADNICVRKAHMDALSRSAQYIANFEPITMISALSSVTDRIGLVATASTSYNEPYHVARKFASIDHLSGGRAGWNLVTSGQQEEAYNFGRDEHYGHSERYDRAREFADVVVGLWDSWDRDAFVRDKEAGLFFHPEKLHPLNHKGQHFAVRGPLNVPRSPQGRPVIVQAGGSAEMVGVATQFAEAIFCAPLTLETGHDLYAKLKGGLAAHGRSPDQMVIMPGLSAIIGRTEAEATEKYEYLQSLIHPIVAREILSTLLGGFDLSPYPFDGPVPEVAPTESSNRSTIANVLCLAKRENLTIRQLAMRVAGARGKSVVKGTPVQIADYMQEWFEQGAADGFNIMPPYLPGALNEFVDLVIPELQRRGLFRTEYEGKTLREHLGLRRPESRYHATSEARDQATFIAAE
jgi:FMN-dependent oxidoreductase (nitrilotriacetate monooxygenase family)